MPQFTMYRNKNPRTKTDIPYLLDVQSNLLSELGTRLVVPLFQKKAVRKAITRLTPELEFEGKKYILMTPQMAGIPFKELGEPAGDLSQNRAEILAAIDLLITGF